MSDNFPNEGKNIFNIEKMYLGWIWFETQVNNFADKETSVLNVSDYATVSNAANSYTSFTYQ